MTETNRKTRETPKKEHPQEKKAQTSIPIDEEIRDRWSPRSFEDRDVPDEALRILFEAARWAPSSFNEQPWRFIVARREDEDQFAKVLECMNEGNQTWAKDAPVLMLTAAHKRFEKTGRPNRHAFHDVGLAMGNLVNQAMTIGIYVHQMAGIDPDRARDLFDVPEDCEVVTGVAIGYLGAPEGIQDPAKRRAETKARERRPLDEMVFAAEWGRPANFVGQMAEVS